MWVTIFNIALLTFAVIAFGGGSAFLNHRREMVKLKIELSKARTEENREKRLLLEAEQRIRQ